MTYFTFSRGLHLMRYGGKKIRRACWALDWYVYIGLNGLFKEILLDNNNEPYDFSNEEILANDWEIYE